MIIKQITKEKLDEWVGLQLALWPNSSKEEIEEESANILESPKFKNFAAIDENDKMAGFINFSLRTDYVAGATIYPVGYIEGIYVKPEYRGMGTARKLVKTAEEWALTQGCSEVASDVELDNADSQKFHESLGFTEDNRIICYIKKI